MFDFLPGSPADLPRARGRFVVTAIALHAVALVAVTAAGLTVVEAVDPPPPRGAIYAQTVPLPPLDDSVVVKRQKKAESVTTKTKSKTVQQLTTVTTLNEIPPVPLDNLGPTAENADNRATDSGNGRGSLNGVAGGEPSSFADGPGVGSSEPTPPDAVYRVGGDISGPILVQQVRPEYPKIAIAMRTQGVVVLQAIIDELGRVVDLSVTSGPAALQAAAVDAARQWRFEPAKLNGRPVRVYFTLTVSFKLT